MPRATNRGVSLYYETAGEGEPVAFVPDLACGAWLWGWQAPALAGLHRTVVPDNRGAGRSDAPPGPYTIEGMAADLEAVLSAAGARSAAIVGAGMGGMIALRHALDYERADRLVLLGTAAAGGEMDTGAMAGDPGDVDAVLSEAFAEEYPEEVERIVAWREEEDADADAAAAQAAAIEAFDLREELYRIEVPALVMHGGADAVVPVGAGETLAGGLPRGEFERLRDEPHFFFIEQARLVTDAIAGFLD